MLSPSPDSPPFARSDSLGTIPEERESELGTDDPPPRTLDSVRLQVAHNLALRVVRKAEIVPRPPAHNGGNADGEEDKCRIGVMLTLSTSSYSASLSPERFLSLIATSLATILTPAPMSAPVSPVSPSYPYPDNPAPHAQPYLFALGAPSSSPDPDYLPPSPPPSRGSVSPRDRRPSTKSASPLLVCSSSPALLSACTTLLASKFLGRVLSAALLPPPPMYPSSSPPSSRSSQSSRNSHSSIYSKMQAHAEPRSAPQYIWLAHIAQLGTSAYDTLALWDALRKVTVPPPPSAVVSAGGMFGSGGAEGLLVRARARLERVTVRQAWEEVRAVKLEVPVRGSVRDEGDDDDRYGYLGEGHESAAHGEEAGVILVDIRSEVERRREGGVPGAVCVERNKLEWTFDPGSPERLPIATRYDLRILLMSTTGRASSLAAASLQDIGLSRTTDVVGGFRRWKDEGLPCMGGEPVG